MFALNPLEVTLVALWFVGIGASLYVGPMLTTQARRIGLVLVAIIVPVLGSLVALGVAGRTLWARRGSRASAPPVTPAGYGSPRD